MVYGDIDRNTVTYGGQYLGCPTVSALFGHFGEVVHVATVQRQQGPEPGEQQAGPGADSRAGPGDQSHLPLQTGHLGQTRV